MPTKVGEMVTFKLDNKLVEGKITGEGTIAGEPVFFIKHGGETFIKAKKFFDTKTVQTLPPLKWEGQNGKR